MKTDETNQASLCVDYRTMLTVSQISKGFGQKTLFTDISLRLLQGERIGLVGPNGCLLYTSPSPRDGLLSRMPSSA